MVIFLLCLELAINAPIVHAQDPEINTIHYLKMSDRIALDLEITDWKWELTADGYQLAPEKGTFQEIPGLPPIPVYSALVAIPPVGDFQISTILGNQKTIQLPGGYSEIKVIQYKIPEMESSENDVDETECSDIFPGQTFRVDSPAWIRDQRVVRVIFYPFQWDCEAKNWVFTSKLQLSLNFNVLETGNKINLIQNDVKTFDAILKNDLINFQDGLRWRNIQKSFEKDSANQVLDSSSPRIRIKIKESGMYQIRYEDLLTLGIDPSQYPFHEYLLENLGRMVSISQTGDGDDQFEPGEAIIFFAEKFDGAYLASLYPEQDDYWLTYSNGWSPKFNAEMIEKYYDKNIYWLSFSTIGSDRIQEVVQTSDNPIVVPNFRFFQEFEQDNKWWTLHFTSEETWFWESNISVSNSIQERLYNFNLQDLDTNANSEAELQLEITSNTSNPIVNPDHSMEVFLNNQFLQTINWDGRTWQSLRIPFSQELLSTGDNILKLKFLPVYGVVANRYGFDQFNIVYKRLFLAHNNEMIFSNPDSGDFTFRINGFSDESPNVWDITSPLKPVSLLDITSENGLLEFSSEQTNPRNYVAYGRSAIRSPEMELTYFSDLHGSTNRADYLIISPNEFIPALKPLVDWRSQQGLNVKVVDLQEVFDQFNFGFPHPIGIKNFIRNTFQTWEIVPTYVLVIGDGHWDLKNKLTDLKNYFPPNFVWVDPTQGEIDSLSDLVAVVGNDPLPDALIGRFPVNSVEELNLIISKTIAFEQSQGDWLNSLSFVSDNFYLTDGCFDDDPLTTCVVEDDGNFPRLMDDFLGRSYLTRFNIRKLYLDDYRCTGLNSVGCDQFTNELVNSINQSPSQIYTYSGHGAINGWANEKIFNVEDLPKLTNQTQFPIFFSLDCIDGFWYYPQGISENDTRSLAEELLRSPISGASAVYSATGFGYSAGHEVLQQGFFDAFNDHKNPSIGQVDLAAKMKVYASGSNDEMLFTYMIFGDPALKMFNDRYFSYLPIIGK